MTEDLAEHAQPLTVLAEDEIIFRDSVRAFADAQIRPLVRDMDEHAKIPRALIDQLFELGRHGHRDSRNLRRRRRPLLPLGARGRRDLAGRPVDRRPRGRPEHAGRSTR